MTRLQATAAILCGLVCGGAQALDLPDVVGLHLVSVHSDSGKAAAGSRGWNNANPGIYARWDNGFTLGGYRNSLFRDSYYAGWTFTDRADRFALTAGVVTGYDKVTSGPGDRQEVRCADTCRTVNLKNVVLPMLVPSVRLPLTQKVSVRLALLLAPRQPAALHLAIEGRF